MAEIAAIYKTHPETGIAAARLNGYLIGCSLAALGIDVDCAPVCDVLTAGTTEAIGDRAFGSDPRTVGLLAEAMAEGLMEAGVLPVIKHMPGHGRAKVDSHEKLPRVSASLEELRGADFAPFRHLAGMPMGMTCHIVFDAVDKDLPVTLSAKAVAQILREEIGFDGLLFSDDISMKALQGQFDARARNILAAGVDVVLHCNGDMYEMSQVAGGAEPLTNAAMARLTRARQMQAGAKKPLPDQSLLATLWQKLDMYLSTAGLGFA